MADRISNIWDARTPHGKDTPWPVLVDLRMEPGLAEPDVDRWVQSACVLCSNGCASLTDITWTVVGQAAQGLRDHGLLDVVNSCERETAAYRHQAGSAAGAHRGGLTAQEEKPMGDNKFRKGDDVSWSSHGQKVHGEVVEKITEDTEAAGRQVRASKEEPQYRVRSDKSGKDAVHKPSALDED
ncbi:hypothetical protein GCM10022247_54830 [Allokutzneria multivorans]|uniref:Hypervirulence associated protein TUDOR domain-containing protein n=1 Tax=Allokutzneria multivorans TaxID=1142134 RepID=A0ABP7TAK5_9PSEU